MSKQREFDFQGIEGKRLRMKMALQHLALGKQKKMRSLINWLDNQPELTEQDDETELMVAIRNDLKQVSWYAATSPQNCLETTDEYLSDLGASQTERELLTQAGKQIQPEALGTWIQLNADGDLDGGWYFPVETTTYHVLNQVASSIDKEIFLEWAETHNVIECEQLRRSVTESQAMTEIFFLLPEVSFREQLAIAKSAFEMLQISWFGSELEQTFRELSVDEIGLVAKFTKEGISQLGIVIVEPITELVLTLCYLSEEFNDQKLALFEGTLATNGVEFLTVSQNNWGLGIELYYLL